MLRQFIKTNRASLPVDHLCAKNFERMNTTHYKFDKQFHYARVYIGTT